MKYNAAHNVCASGYTCVSSHYSSGEFVSEKTGTRHFVKDWHLK